MGQFDIPYISIVTYGALKDALLVKGRIRSVATSQQCKLLQQPVIQISDIERHIQKSRGTATKLVNLAEQLGIIQQISKGRRNRKYAYAEYVGILSEGTELN